MPGEGGQVEPPSGTEPFLAQQRALAGGVLFDGDAAGRAFFASLLEIGLDEKAPARVETAVEALDPHADSAEERRGAGHALTAALECEASLAGTRHFAAEGAEELKPASEPIAHFEPVLLFSVGRVLLESFKTTFEAQGQPQEVRISPPEVDAADLAGEPVQPQRKLASSAEKVAKEEMPIADEAATASVHRR